MRHLVTEYVVARERYVPAIAESDYRQVGAYQSAALNQSWATLWARGNPESPLNRYGDASQVRVSVNAVTFLHRGAREPSVVQVRFASALGRAVGAAEETHHFVATLQATFVDPPTDNDARARNPLGFRVLEYKREPENVEPDAGMTITSPPNHPGARS